MSLPIACHNDQFGTLGQIDPSHLAQIAEQGYKSVINNRLITKAALINQRMLILQQKLKDLVCTMYICQSLAVHLLLNKLLRWPV